MSRVSGGRNLPPLRGSFFILVSRVTGLTGLLPNLQGARAPH